jgi:hypothetical protein
VLEASQHAGFRAGITTVQRKNSLRLLQMPGFRLYDRFNPVVENGRPALEKLRSGFQLKTRLKQWMA